MRRLRARYRREGRDLVGAFRRLEDSGRLEMMASAATHGFLPLLARDESIRLQLALGRSSTGGCSGAQPRGCWLPECAYRPRGGGQPLPDAPARGSARGNRGAPGRRRVQLLLHRRAPGARGERARRLRRGADRPNRHGGTATRRTRCRMKRRPARPTAATASLTGRSGQHRWRCWCAIRAPRCRCGAGTTGTPATSGTSSSTRSAGRAGSSSGG